MQNFPARLGPFFGIADMSSNVCIYIRDCVSRQLTSHYELCDKALIITHVYLVKGKNGL